MIQNPKFKIFVKVNFLNVDSQRLVREEHKQKKKCLTELYCNLKSKIRNWLTLGVNEPKIYPSLF